MTFQEEPNDREKTILVFCEQQQEKLTRALNKTYKEGKSIQRLDETQKRLKKLMPAKLALAQLMRAIKKRDYMMLSSDQVTEIDTIKPIVPEIVQYAEDVRELRAIQKGIFNMQFRKDSPDEERHNIFTLPQLPSRAGRNKTNSSTIDALDSRKNTRMIANKNVKIDGSPLRHSLEARKAKEYDEMKKEMQLMSDNKKGDRIINL